MDVPWRLPLMQAPIGPAATPELVAAVSVTGALGTLAASWTPVAALRAQVRRLRSTVDAPFCVNLVLAFEQRERLAVVLDEGAPLVSFSWGIDAEPIALARGRGAYVLVQVGEPEDAAAAVAAGADALILQGVEAGGHVQSTRPLVELVREVRASAGVPLVAAGGIGDPARARAAREAGADAIACGTAFLAAEEADVHPTYLGRLVSAGGDDTALTTAFDGGWPHAPHRVLRNATLDCWEQAGRPSRGSRPGEGDVVGSRHGHAVRRYADAQPTRDTVGDIDAMALYAGTSVEHVDRRRPAASIVARLAAGGA